MSIFLMPTASVHSGLLANSCLLGIGGEKSSAILSRTGLPEVKRKKCCC
jgi:hypothetical protein